jgi:hypothetical protein
MSIELAKDEISYLLILLNESRNYYRILAGNANCGERNRQMFGLVERLWQKLETTQYQFDVGTKDK